MLEFNLHLLGGALAALAAALGRALAALALGGALAALAHGSELGHVSLGSDRTLDHVGGLGLATSLLLGRGLTGSALGRLLGSGAAATAGRGEGSGRK